MVAGVADASFSHTVMVQSDGWRESLWAVLAIFVSWYHDDDSSSAGTYWTISKHFCRNMLSFCVGNLDGSGRHLGGLLFASAVFFVREVGIQDLLIPRWM